MRIAKLKHLFLLLLIPGIAIAQNCRYYNRIFPSVTKTANVTYATAPGIPAIYVTEAVTTSQTLTMDIFQPASDTAQKRAMIIFAHSGGFINGTKDNADMQALCDSFAHLGYVTATLNYRLNFNLLSSSSSERAVWRGIQDASSAVRYFKNFATTYKIDTGNIFFWGSSAGAFMSLGLAYLDDIERPSSTYSGFLQPDLGCKDCTGNSYAYPSTVKGIISCWGATKDTAWIQNNNNTPALLFHGTADATVPYTEGYPFGLPTITYVRGSQEINQQLNRTSIYHEFYSEAGLGHEYWGTSNGAFPVGGPNFYWTDIIIKTKLFLIGRMGTSLPCVNLPVRLADFSGTMGQGKVDLDWNTAEENNLQDIRLERSNDAYTFTELGRFSPAAAPGGGAHYRFTDDHPVYGQNYYRLKMIDGDQHFTYSSMLKFFVGPNDLVITDVYPNPVTDQFSLRIRSPRQHQVQASVVDLAGRTLAQIPLTLQNGLNEIRIPFRGYSAGLYWVRFHDAGGGYLFQAKLLKTTDRQ